MKEYCNPINIEYKFQHYGNYAHREAADPSLIYFKGLYYMFASMSAGFYYSEDMISWKWHENRALDIYRYAPDVRQIGEYLYFSASMREGVSTIWRCKNPLSGDFEKVSEPFAFWDPNLFCDEDGRVYLYWGCSNKEPIYGIELDRETLMPIGDKKPLIDSDIKCHGWERFRFPGKVKIKSRNFLFKFLDFIFNIKGRPYMEGAFVNKWNGYYYLQYAAPGTEYPVYGDGVYRSSHPLGPYTMMPNTPFSLKPSGFITGAGHGSTIEDEYGNLWHAATMRISVNMKFERRLGIFPAGIDENGVLYCNQNFADYPIIVPDGKFDARSIVPRYMLLSYKKKAVCSSVFNKHNVELALNEDIRTWWCANGGAGEWYQLDLGKVYIPHSIQLNIAEEGIQVKKYDLEECSPDFDKRYTDSGRNLKICYLMEGSVDGSEWFVIKDSSESSTDLAHEYLVLQEGTKLRYIKITAVHLPYHSKFAISGLRVFGLDSGNKPSAVSEAKAFRSDELTAKVTWKKAEGAIGYNIRYGIDTDKLYNSYLVYDTEEVLITTLNKGQNYWFCVDSFNESGITEGIIKKIGTK